MTSARSEPATPCRIVRRASRPPACSRPSRTPTGRGGRPAGWARPSSSCTVMDGSRKPAPRYRSILWQRGDSRRVGTVRLPIRPAPARGDGRATAVRGLPEPHGRHIAARQGFQYHAAASNGLVSAAYGREKRGHGVDERRRAGPHPGPAPEPVSLVAASQGSPRGHGPGARGHRIRIRGRRTVAGTAAGRCGMAGPRRRPVPGSAARSPAGDRLGTGRKGGGREGLRSFACREVGVSPRMGSGTAASFLASAGIRRDWCSRCTERKSRWANSSRRTNGGRQPSSCGGRWWGPSRTPPHRPSRAGTDDSGRRRDGWEGSEPAACAAARHRQGLSLAESR